MPYYDPSKNKPQGLYFSKPPFERPLFVWREIWAINLMGGFLHLREGGLPSFFFLHEFFSRAVLSERLEQANPASRAFFLLAWFSRTQSIHTNKNICLQHYIILLPYYNLAHSGH